MNIELRLLIPVLPQEILNLFQEQNTSITEEIYYRENNLDVTMRIAAMLDIFDLHEDVILTHTVTPDGKVDTRCLDKALEILGELQNRVQNDPDLKLYIIDICIDDPDRSLWDRKVEKSTSTKILCGFLLWYRNSFIIKYYEPGDVHPNTPWWRGVSDIGWRPKNPIEEAMISSLWPQAKTHNPIPIGGVELISRLGHNIAESGNDCILIKRVNIDDQKPTYLSWMYFYVIEEMFQHPIDEKDEVIVFDYERQEPIVVMAMDLFNSAIYQPFLNAQFIGFPKDIQVKIDAAVKAKSDESYHDILGTYTVHEHSY